MNFTKILANPPYLGSLGGKIMSFVHDEYLNSDYVILMPVSNYKSNKLYSFVKEIQMSDPKFFSEADLTKQLCICKVGNEKTYRDFIELEMKTYKPNFFPFYEKNYKLPIKYVFERCDYSTEDDFNFECDFVDSSRLVNWDTGILDGGKGQGYKWNVQRERKIFIHALCVIRFNKPKERENFTTWAYSDSKNGLTNKLLFGLNKQTTSRLCYLAIPQIDWENIDKTDLWKNKDYDGAVLKEMGLKWSEDRNAVEYI